MRLNPDSQKPLYLQIAEQIEEDIFLGRLEEETQVPSTNEVALGYQLNPATVLKGMNILVDERVIYKKRGIGMFVCTGALNNIKQKRQNNFYAEYVDSLVAEAKKLNIEREEIIKMINRRYIDE
ncbi:MAG: GntR family transcriptional regulator [Clostridia bacterium]|nr:GntR family transcriptional regulator [Clostridia bacterium]